MTGRQGGGRDRPSASGHVRDRPSRTNQSSQQRLPPQEDQEMSGTGPSLRSNEYFVPRDGIDREVITADICRYLGNDALVRPGTYETKDGRTEQGYFIIAYRNLTSAMIQDLKADSARWEQERRSQPTRTAPGGAPSGAQFQGPGYRASETHQQRQYYGPTGAEQQYGGDAMAIDPYSSAPPPARYPGTGSHGYTGASSGGYAAQQPQQYQSQSGYPPQQSAPYSGPVAAQYPSEQSRYQETGFGSQAFNSHPGAAPMGFSSHPTAAPPQQVGYVTGSNMPVNPGLVSGPYMDYSRTGLPPSSSPSAGPGAYVTAGPRQPTYQSAAEPVPPFYSSVPMAQPLDVAYGRGPGSGAYTTATASDQETTSDYTVSPSVGPPQAAYGTVPAASEYEEAPPPSLASGQSTSASTQGLSSGSSSRREAPRDRDRERDREAHRRERERTGEQDRDTDRHASERHERRSHRTRQ